MLLMTGGGRGGRGGRRGLRPQQGEGWGQQPQHQAPPGQYNGGYVEQSLAASQPYMQYSYPQQHQQMGGPFHGSPAPMQHQQAPMSAPADPYSFARAAAYGGGFGQQVPHPGFGGAPYGPPPPQQYDIYQAGYDPQQILGMQPQTQQRMQPSQQRQQQQQAGGRTATDAYLSSSGGRQGRRGGRSGGRW
jgi:hypothetical protein